MSWFKVDDSLAFHSKTVAAGNAAMGLWIRAGAWSSAQLTDGFIPRQIANTIGNRAQAKALVDAGLWLEDPRGYRFHDWNHYQPSAADVLADRAEKHQKKQEAGRLGGIASGVARRKHSPSRSEANGQAEGKQNEAPTRPEPVSASACEREDVDVDLPATPTARDRALATWDLDLPQDRPA